MVKTALFGKSGARGIVAIEDQSFTTGNRFFVDSGSSTNGSTSGFGDSPDAPFDQIESVNNASVLTANNGDVVYVMPGHNESVDAAGDLDCDIAGVRYVALGHGSDAPTITLGTVDTSDIDINAANVVFEGFHFVANFLDIVAAIDVNSDDFALRRCRFTDNSTVLNAKIWVQDGSGTTSDRMTIEDCWSDCLGTANTHLLNLAGTGNGHIIRRNILIGDWATMCLGGAGLVTQCSILNNFILNIDTSADVCISMGATATGICAWNACGGGHASQGIIPGDLASIENYYEQHTSDLSGILEPANA